MSASGTPAPTTTGSTLLNTIVADLHAGESWFANEFEGGALFLWNALKGAFIALAPAAGQILVDTLTNAVADAGAGKSVEEIEQHALNTASTEGKAAITQAGSGVVQTVIAGLRSNLLPGAPTTPATGS